MRFGVHAGPFFLSGGSRRRSGGVLGAMVSLMVLSARLALLSMWWLLVGVFWVYRGLFLLGRAGWVRGRRWWARRGFTDPWGR